MTAYQQYLEACRAGYAGTFLQWCADRDEREAGTDGEE